MTINHVFVYVSHARFATMRQFYNTALKPIGYAEMIHPREDLIAFGSDFPYFWLKRLDKDQPARPVHVAFDASDNNSVDEFWNVASKAGGTDNGRPGIREEMSRQPYYAAFVIDPDGNNIEAVCVDKAGVKASKKI